MHKQIPLTELVFDATLYPRANVNQLHVLALQRAMEAGITLPPIVVASGSNIIIDGVHRHNAHLRHGDLQTIAAVVKNYSSREEMFRDAISYNSGVGLKLGQHDMLKCIQVCEGFGMRDLDISACLRTSIAHLRVLKPRYATVEQAGADTNELRRVPLKASVRHLSGTTITPGQEQAMTSAPGVSYLLITNQLLDAMKYDLLPPEDRHQVLWQKLRELSDLILQQAA
jgi:hypothetical protein